MSKKIASDWFKDCFVISPAASRSLRPEDVVSYKFVPIAFAQELAAGFGRSRRNHTRRWYDSPKRTTLLDISQPHTHGDKRMNSEEILKTCIRELKRCGISFLLIVIGVFLATQNAPAAPSPNQNQCLESLAIINTLASRPIKSATQALVQPVGNTLNRFHTKPVDRKCIPNLSGNKAGKQYK
ncbi:hypothetical protein ACH50O_10460 [Methylomonas sp. 2BW1-5-20]|uniref:hypothetical protein n=1 Tax=Methylomonas sp. 2BW1-5-20 TaxID=3376686 RepID=UPI00404F98DC